MIDRFHEAGIVGAAGCRWRKADKGVRWGRAEPSFVQLIQIRETPAQKNASTASTTTSARKNNEMARGWRPPFPAPARSQPRPQRPGRMSQRSNVFFTALQGWAGHCSCAFSQGLPGRGIGPQASAVTAARRCRGNSETGDDDGKTELMDLPESMPIAAILRPSLTPLPGFGKSV